MPSPGISLGHRNTDALIRVRGMAAQKRPGYGAGMASTQRAVEVLHDAGTSAEPSWTVGSGYLIGGRLVLTSAHNVGFGTCLVRLVDGSEHAATVRLRGDEVLLDLAVLELVGDDAPDVRGQVGYALVSQESAEVIGPCTGLGFPRYKEDETRQGPRSRKRLRNIEQLDGEIPAAAGALAGLLTFRVTARPREQPPLPAGPRRFADSPWQGISGTVVFVRGDAWGERAIGVVTEHHLSEGGSALTLVPFGAIGASSLPGMPGGLPPAEQRAWWDLLGVADPGTLPVLPARSPRRPRPPAPPHGAVDRPAHAAAALAALRDGPGPLVVLVGGPGFGKTVLARQVAAAADAQAGAAGPGRGIGFPGGVLWLDVGQDPDLSSILAQAFTDLTGQPATARSVPQLVSDLREALLARHSMLVLDDVWPGRRGRDDVVELLVRQLDGVPRLVTTRSATLLDLGPRARLIDVAELEPGEAAALLAKALPETASDADRARLGELAFRLGRWPLLLGLAAAYLRQRVSAGVPLDEALRYLAERYAARGVTAFDARHADLLDASDPAQRHQAVTAAVEASLGLLTAADRVRYRQLAVFPPGQAVPVDVVASLWSPALDRFEADDLMATLASLSLLVLDLRTGQVRVHDLLRDYLLPADARDQQALHRGLLRGWGDPLLLGDSYRVRWYAYHLDAAGDEAGLYALITPAWRNRVLAVTGTLSDVAADAHRAADYAARHGQVAEELRCRLVATVIVARVQALPRALLAALAAAGRADRALGEAALLTPVQRGKTMEDITAAVLASDPGKACAIADDIAIPGSKARALAGIAAAVANTDAGHAAALLQRAQAAAQEPAGDPADRARALARVAAVLSGMNPGQAESLASQIADPIERAQALALVAAAVAGDDPGWASRLADRAAAAAEEFGDPWETARSLAKVAAALGGAGCALTSGLADRAVAAAESVVEGPVHKAQAIAVVAAELDAADPRRASSLVDRAVAVARTADNRQLALMCVAEAVAAADPDRAFAVADMIDNPLRRDGALAEIAVALARSDPRRALAVADSIGSGRWRALAGIAQVLASIDPQEALATADRIGDAHQKAEALAGIAAALAATDPGLALAIAERIDASKPTSAADLSEIAAALAAADPGLAVTVADRVEDPAKAAWALGRIAAAAVLARDTSRAGPLTLRALAVADRAKETWDSARILTWTQAAFAGTPPEWLTTSDPDARVRALAIIATELATADPDQALAIADRIGDPLFQELTLAAIAATVAEADRGRAGPLFDRAVAAAELADGPANTALARAGLAAAMAGTDPSRAASLADQALHSALLIPRPADRDEILAEISAELARAEPDRAARMADRIGDPGPRAWAVAAIAAAVAAADPGRAGQLAGQALAAAARVADPDARLRVLGGVAANLADAGPGTVTRLTDQALSAIVRSPYGEAASWLTSGIAAALAASAVDAHAIALPDQALSKAVSFRGPEAREWVFATLAAARGGLNPSAASEAAESAITALADGVDRVCARAGLAAAVTGAEPGRAGQLADQALAAADHIDDTWDAADALAGIAVMLAVADPGRAVAAADRIHDPGPRAGALKWVAAVLALADPGRSAQLADRALDAADQVEDARSRATALAEIACVLAGPDPGRALAVADRIHDPEIQASVMTTVADVHACLAGLPGAAPGPEDGSGAVGQLMPRVRRIDPAIASGAWWALARLLTIRAATAPERAALVHAVLTVGEW